MQTYGNTTSILPTDANSSAIQALAPDYVNAVAGTSTAAHATVTLPTGRDILFISNTQDMWITFGGPSDSPVASAGGSGCILLLAGERILQCPRTLQTSGGAKVYLPVTKLDVVRASADGNFSVVGMV